ncbi:glycosyltransferase [Terribacillus saccharophilus]|uniref:glycosyltransferase n=1 Tax=Terribacillus saccharophilus TaxID=361277 RepID=UPI000C9A6348|nr:glycosyltransferase family 4 protein [Terribacillus goriensis]MEC0282049.1 glycosyltransferase family 4 protein [Terribacillus saccharophilus]MEC0291162.1 glycosyltransferase family 4 protein [Terribacillus saccharophilus]
MKILFIATTFPYPKDNGKRIILSSIFEYLIEKHGIDNIKMCLIGNETVEPKWQSKMDITILQKPGSIEQLMNIAIYTLLGRKSIQESMLYSKVTKQKLNKLISNEKYDLIIYDTVRASQYASDIAPAKEIVYLDDLFSIRYEKMIETLNKYPEADLNPLGNFEKNIPLFLLPILKNDVVKKSILNFEKKKVRNSELRTCKSIEDCLLISDKEIKYLHDNYQISNVQSIKPVIASETHFRDNSYNKSTFIFLGNLSIAHNSVSLMKFLQLNIKKIIEHNLKVKIIGKNANEELSLFVQKYKENIILTGYVEDLGKELSSAAGMLIPLLFGSGVKIKTIEAFAAGLPVITTDFGIEGISVQNAKEPFFILENNIENYWKSMLELSETGINDKFSELSRIFFESNYSKEAIYDEYEKLLG